MSWKIKEPLQKRLGREQGAVVKEWGGRASVALLFPGPYRVGMGNLGVHALYGMLGAHPGICCERAFLPDPAALRLHRATQTPVLSLETQRPLHEFDWIAITCSFENDYRHLLPILQMSRIPWQGSGRGEGMPLIIAGGAAPTLNPLPLSALADAVITGDAEAYPELLDLIASRPGRDEAISALAGMDGVLCGTGHDVRPRHAGDLDAFPTQSVIHAPDAEFGELHLIEVERGCPRHCRFCATPAIYGPVRRRSASAVLSMAREGLAHRKRFGLIGADILSHPEFEAIAEGIHAMGGTFSPSSVRADAVTPENAGLLAASGHKSVSLGVEAGSERLRATLGKGLSDARLLQAVATLAATGITRLRLYFMVGLPDETEEDIAAIAALAIRARDALRAAAPKASRSTAVDLTVTPFVPKPGTAFAGKPFAGAALLKGKYKALKRLLGRTPGIALRTDAISQAELEWRLACGDEGILASFDRGAVG